MPGWNDKKNQAKAKQHSHADFVLFFEDYSLSSSTLSSKKGDF